ncbi:MAG: aldo/keto reductase [Acidobacteria bacterium]|nr:aldo/keto reductase [Acidobacteriota bacterium]
MTTLPPQRSRRNFLQLTALIPALAATKCSKPATETDLVPFGATDLRVSRLCQGTAFRQIDRAPDAPAGQAILRRCLDLGVNFFDSSNAYGWGGAEMALGKAIHGHPRDKLVICTKVHPASKPAGDEPSKPLEFTREFAFQECEASLKRLGTDYVDLYLLHNPDELTLIEQVADTMDALVKSGKVRYWGLSNHTSAAVRQAIEHAGDSGQSGPAGLQHYFNIIGRQSPEQTVPSLEQELFPLIRQHKLGLQAFSPLAAGELAPGKKAEPGSPLENVLKVMDEVAGDLHATRPQIAIAWVLTHPEVTSALAGAEKPEHVEDNVAGSRLAVPAEALAALNAASDAYMQAMPGA